MSRTIIRLAVPLLGSAVLSFAVAACSSDTPAAKNGGADASSGGNTADSGAAGKGGAGGKGGTSAGGKGGTSGGAATGGAANDGGSDYKCTPHAVGMLADGGTKDPGGAVLENADCCGGLGACAKASSLPKNDPASSAYGHETCKAASDLVCVPKPASALPDGGLTPSCHIGFGSLNLEGRCLPKCFVLNNPNANQLNKGDCGANLGFDAVCAPCYDPTTGKSTGACNRGTDAPVEGSRKFASCGAYGDSGANAAPQGLCVPKAQVVAAGIDLAAIPLPQDTCATGDLCSPKGKVVDQGSCLAHCTSIVGPGACVSTFVVEAIPAGKGLSGTLGQVTCAAGETCTPCINPTGGLPTGACSN